MNDKIEQLREEAHSISTEAFTMNLPNLNIIHKLKEFVASAKTTMLDLFKSNEEDEDVKLAVVYADKELGDVVFTDVSSLDVKVPSGFTGKAVPYLKALLNAFEEISMVNNNILLPYASHLGQVINRPDLLDDSSRRFAMKEVDIKRHQKVMKAFFDVRKTDKVDRKLGTVIDRIGDWNDIEALSKKLAELDEKHSREEILNTISRLDGLIDSLIEILSDPNTNTVVRDATSKELTKVTFAMAEHVTFYSIVRTSVQMTLVALNRMKEQVKEVK